jgi:hypothetical protein
MGRKTLLYSNRYSRNPGLLSLDGLEKLKKRNRSSPEEVFFRKKGRVGMGMSRYA